MIGRDEPIGRLVFCDCSAQSPEDRRSACYDRDAWQSRKGASATGQRARHGRRDRHRTAHRAQYRMLQQLGEFDTNPRAGSSPARVRALGARSSATGATARSSSTTTAPSRTTRRAVSAAACGCECGGMRVSVNGARLFFEVEGTRLRIDGAAMRGCRRSCCCRRSGVDHAMYRPADRRCPTSRRWSTSTTAATAATTAPRPSRGTWRSGPTT